MTDISRFKEVLSDVRPPLFESFEPTTLTMEKLRELDTPITERVNIRETLKPLSDESKEALKEKGYSDDVIEAIGSEEEAQIYTDAELECLEVNGKDALVYRVERVKEATPANAPILYQYGAFGQRLGKFDNVDQLFKHRRATVSLGYIGLYEVASVF